MIAKGGQGSALRDGGGFYRNNCKVEPLKAVEEEVGPEPEGEKGLGIAGNVVPVVELGD